jgi:hypothetical protein
MAAYMHALPTPLAACAIACLLLAAGCAPTSSNAVAALATESDVLDGSVLDLAAAEDATADPDGARIWIAEGRVRAAVRASTRERMISEDETFPAGARHKEKVEAVEVDDAGRLLYTLTDTALYRESFDAPHSQSAPGDLVRLDLTKVLDPPLHSPEEYPRDVKVAGPGLCAVMTTRRIVLVSSLPDGIEVLSQAKELLDAPLRARPPDPAFDQLRIAGLWRMTVATDSSQQTIAYCRATSDRYPDAPSISEVDRKPEVLLLCRLGTPQDGFLNPTFDSDPSADVAYSYWDPFSAAPAYQGNGEGLGDHTLYDVEVRVLSGETHVYCACGKAKQLRELRATFGPGNGVEPLSTIALDPQQDLHLCKRDPAIPDSDALYVHGSSRLFSLRLDPTPTFTALDDEPFFAGGQGECAFVHLGSASGTLSTLWTEGSGIVDHLCKAFDVGAATPAVLGKLGGLWESDGAVATGPDDVYLPTMGAVTHYHRTDGIWTTRTTQADEIPPGSGIIYNTESIDLGEVAPGDGRLYIAANAGLANSGHWSGVVEMPIGTDGEPQQPACLDSQAFWSAVGWDPSSQLVYTNDVQFQDYAGSKLVLNDMACPVHAQGALIVHRWDPARATWSCAGYALADLSPNAPGLTYTMTTSAGDSGKLFAFVGNDSGVFSVDLTPLSGSPPGSMQVLPVPSDVLSPNGTSLRHTGGIAASGDRLFVFFNNGPPGGSDAPPEICVFRWNRGTGEILTPPEVVYRPKSADSPLHIPSYARTWRVRFVPEAGGGPGGKLYDSNDTRLFEITYDAHRPSDPLRYTGIWESDYAGFLQDSRAYDFGSGTRLLVVKGGEAFAYVEPSN